MIDSLKNQQRTSHNSNSPHLPSLYVILKFDLVGRNSNPSSSQGVSNSAVPGFPREVLAANAFRDVVVVAVVVVVDGDVFDDVVINEGLLYCLDVVASG